MEVLEAINDMLSESVARFNPGWSNNIFLWSPYTITVIEESVFRSVPDRGDPSVMPRCVFRSELQGVGQCQAGECCEQERAVWRGWMLVCMKGNKACSRGLRVKVLSCSEEAFGGETSSPDISKVKRELSKSRNSLSEPLQWKEEIGIDSPVTEATFDMILNDLAFCLLRRTQGLIWQQTKGVNEWTVWFWGL